MKELSSVVTMTSAEIANLTGKSKFNVHADIRNQLLKGLYNIDTAEESDTRIDISIRGITGLTANLVPSGLNAGKVDFFTLDKRHTLILVSGYEVRLRAAIIDRLEQLELAQSKPETKSDVDKLAGAVEIAARMLNFSESAKVTALATMIPELRPMLPNYVVDKSAVSLVGSSDVTHSLSHLLKEHGVNLSAIQANKLLHSSGILTKHIRRSFKGDDKTFWAFTDNGLVYGKNVTNPANPRETQPLFFDKMFTELVDKFLV